MLFKKRSHLIKVSVILLLFSFNVFGDSWTPKLEFSIEQLTYKESLSFIAGISYTLIYSDKMLKSEKKNNFYCISGNKIPDSKLLIELLNNKLKGNKNSEQVIDTIIQELSKMYPCKKSIK